MKFVKPEVFLLGRTVLDVEAVRKFCDFHEVSEYFDKQFGNTAPKESDGAKLVMLAGKRCYKAFIPKLNPNVTKVRESAVEYIDNILQSGHGSVVEHVVYNFGIENVSRVLTGELNRHRAGAAISEGSMRYIRFNNIPCCSVPSIDIGASAADNITSKKIETREVFKRVFQMIETEYAALEEIWKDELAEDSKFANKKAVTSMLRRIVPMGVATGGIWSYNLRALRHIFTMRCDEAAEEEIQVVAVMMLELMRAADPLFFADFEQNKKGFWRPKYWKI